MITTTDLRQSFLNHFNTNKHKIYPSSPLVPQNDPTLLFTTAGMVQFKNYFTGADTPKDTRVATSQKCVRAGGKHNDLERVGYTARHHTFFEMLGNFSFGDYFKEEAIHLAWDLITREWGLNKDKLLVTIYHTDEEAHKFWSKIAGLPDHKIIRIATDDNFWSMGDTGPCGPCSEIFYDHGDHIRGGPPGSPDEDGDRFIEIWNLVFMQYEKQAGGKQIELPKPSIDTGMGIERIATVLQGKHDNYDIDLFQHLIAASVEKSKTKAVGEALFSHRVIADHLRSSSFLIADGVLPSNEGRGYVLRRIMRRAMRHAHILGCKDPLLYQLFPALQEQMGRAYPELNRAAALITETLKLEEERFKVTLDRGLKLLAQETENLKQGDVLSGETAFKLYDTYGFPLDLTQDILKSQKMTVNIAEFDQAMAKQKAEAKASWVGSGEAATETVWFDLKAEIGGTEFLGYQTENAQGNVLGLVKDGAVVDSLKKGDKGYIITNQTPFYPESGGQVGDTGSIKNADVLTDVTDVRRHLGSLIAHEVYVKDGSISKGKEVSLIVSPLHRQRARANHSATHLLHEALRRVLGDHVTQKGSLVEPQRLRFDFSHPKALTAEEILAIETDVNQHIFNNTPVETHLMSPEDAIKKGALALFGEKYGEEVRVVSMGPQDTEKARVYSVELCGGTHVSRTGDIGGFKIIAESAVAAGVRRIEALTNMGLINYLRQQDQILNQAAAELKTKPEDVSAKIQKLVDDKKRLERELSQAKQNSFSGASDVEAVKINGFSYLGQVVQNVEPKDLKPMVDRFKQKLGSAVIALASIQEGGQTSLVVGVTNDLTDRFSAVHFVQLGSEILGGKGGGGRPDMAQSGGPDNSKINDVLARIEQELKNAS